MPCTKVEAHRLREEIVSLIALFLRERTASNKPRCCWDAVCFITSTSRKYWNYVPTGSSASRLVHLGLETYTHRLDDRANLDSFYTMRSTACRCGKRCHETSLHVLSARYSEIGACRSHRDENVVVVRLMWGDVGRETSLCRDFISSWLGISAYRLSALKITVESALESGIDLRCGIAFLEKGTDGRAWLLGATENDGRGGSGRTPQRVVDLVTQHFHTYTRTLPGAAFRRCVRTDADGVGALWAKLQLESPGIAAEISSSTFRRLLSKQLESEGLVGLQKLINDHNADKVEKATTYALDRAHYEEMQARIGGDLLGAEEFARRKTKLLANLERHRANRYRIRQFEAENIALGKALLEAQRRRFDDSTSSGGADAAFLRDAPFNSLPISHNSHEDDASAINEPMFKLEHQGMGLERYTRGVHGSCDLQRIWMHFYLPELGFGAKNASSVTDEVIVDLLENLNGEQFVVLYMDCAALNQNCWVALGLPQLLVDLKICTFAMIVFFWQNDSKDGSDRAFGKLHEALENSCVVGADELAIVAENAQTSALGFKATARIVEPYACSDWTSFFNARYHVDDDFYKNMGMKASNTHCVVAGHASSSLCDEEVEFETRSGVKKISLRAYLERLGSGVEGAVRCYTFPPLVDEEITPDAYFDFLVHKHDAKFAEIKPRLPRPVAMRPPAPAAVPAATALSPSLAATPAAAAAAAAPAPLAPSTTPSTARAAVPPATAHPAAPSAAPATAAHADAPLAAPPSAKRSRTPAAAPPCSLTAEPPAAKRRRNATADALTAELSAARGAALAEQPTAPLRSASTAPDSALVPAAGPPPHPQPPGQDEESLLSMYNKICTVTTERSSKGHTKTQVMALGYNCFSKINDPAFAADLTAKAEFLYPGGIAGYDPALGECMQPNWITRAPSEVPTYPRFAFVNALNERPEHHLFEATPVFENRPVMALNDQRGHSLRYGGSDSVFFALEQAAGGRLGMCSVPRISDVIELVAQKLEVDLRTPPLVSPELEQQYSDAMKARKKLHAEIKRERSTRGPRKPLEFFAASHYFDKDGGVTAALAYKSISPQLKMHFATLGTKAEYYHTLAALEDSLLGGAGGDGDDDNAQ